MRYRGLVAAVVVGVVAASCTGSSPPQRFNPGVTIGEGLLAKKRVLFLEHFGGVSDIAVLPGPAGEPERLLVGYGPEVWEYRGKRGP